VELDFRDSCSLGSVMVLRVFNGRRYQDDGKQVAERLFKGHAFEATFLIGRFLYPRNAPIWQ
jgi:hypothetical protein